MPLAKKRHEVSISSSYHHWFPVRLGMQPQQLSLALSPSEALKSALKSKNANAKSACSESLPSVKNERVS